MKKVEKQVKTMWAGKLWIHAKYMNKAKHNKVPLVIKYAGNTMTIPYQDLRDRYVQMKQVEDKFRAGVMHNQYGFLPEWDEKK